MKIFIFGQKGVKCLQRIHREFLIKASVTRMQATQINNISKNKQTLHWKGYIPKTNLKV